MSTPETAGARRNFGELLPQIRHPTRLGSLSFPTLNLWCMGTRLKGGKPLIRRAPETCPEFIDLYPHVFSASAYYFLEAPPYELYAVFVMLSPDRVVDYT